MRMDDIRHVWMSRVVMHCHVGRVCDVDRVCDGVIRQRVIGERVIRKSVICQRVIIPNRMISRVRNIRLMAGAVDRVRGGGIVFG